RAAGLDRLHERTHRLAEADGFGDLSRQARDDDADPAADDAAAHAQLLRHAGRLVDRNRERDPHVAARTAVDLRIDADDFAAHVDERAARVAGIDGDVGLDQGQEIARVA